MNQDIILTPLTDAEKKITIFQGNKKDQFTPITPVPDDAPPFTKDMCVHHNKEFSQKPSCWYPYHIAEGGLVGYMVRWDNVLQKDGSTKKETRPYVYVKRENGQKFWHSQGLPEPRPLYKLPEIINRPNADILVVEGEKTAEAAQSVFPHLVVTATLFGSMAPHKTDWSYVMGRNVIISPDFDGAGIKYGDSVYNLCKKADAKSIKLLSVETLAKKLLGKENIPPKYDIADAVKDGLSQNVFEASGIPFEDLLTPYFTQIEIQSRSLPDGFRLDEHGSVYKKKDEDPEKEDWLCSYLVVTNLVRDKNSNGWSKIARLQDRKGNFKEILIKESELVGDGNALKEKLVDLGVRINFFEGNLMNKKSLLKYYISVSTPKAVALSVDRTGWHGQAYVLSENKIYGAHQEERIIFDATMPSAPCEQNGKLEDWQNTIGKLAAGNSRLQFPILAALTAPLLSPLEEDNYGIHLVGGSSIGKTTALHVASSVWGKGIKTWRTTDNAAESLARCSNDGLLILDELNQVGGDAADAMAYMLGNGAGKARANKHGDARPISIFKLIFLSSGEVGLEAKISETKGNKKLKGGQTVRFIEIPADAGQGNGIFENLHEFKSSCEFADKLKEFTLKYRGTLIEAWLESLAKNLPYHVTQIQKLRKVWLAENPLEKKADGQVERVRNKMALIAAVGEHAISEQLLPWNKGDAFLCCSKIFNSWLAQRGGVESFEVTQVMNRLVSFLNEHGSSRFENAWGLEDKGENQDKPQIEKVVNRVGFRKLINNVWTHYFEILSFHTEILQCGDQKALLKALASKGVFKTKLEKVNDGSEKNRYTVSVRVPGSKQKRLYEISNEWLEKMSDLTCETP